MAKPVGQVPTFMILWLSQGANSNEENGIENDIEEKGEFPADLITSFSWVTPPESKRFIIKKVCISKGEPV